VIANLEIIIVIIIYRVDFLAVKRKINFRRDKRIAYSIIV